MNGSGAWGGIAGGEVQSGRRAQKSKLSSSVQLDEPKEGDVNLVSTVYRIEDAQRVVTHSDILTASVVSVDDASAANVDTLDVIIGNIMTNGQDVGKLTANLQSSV